jgi:hypothetical protein
MAYSQATADAGPLMDEAEAKGRYKNILSVETMSIQTLEKIKLRPDDKINNEGFEVLVKLQMTLIKEHEEFFSSSQHPAASGGMKRLIVKYGLHERVWRHGIKDFLECLRLILPESKDHMERFVSVAVHSVRRLSASKPDLIGFWLDCHRDISRYKSALESGTAKESDELAEDLTIRDDDGKIVSASENKKRRHKRHALF